MSFVLFAQLNLGKSGATEYVVIPATDAYSLGTVTTIGQEDAVIAIASSSSARVIVTGDEAISLVLVSQTEGHSVEGIQGSEVVELSSETETQGTVWPWITGTESIYLPLVECESDGRPEILGSEGGSCPSSSYATGWLGLAGDEGIELETVSYSLGDAWRGGVLTCDAAVAEISIAAEVIADAVAIGIPATVAVSIAATRVPDTAVMTISAEATTPMSIAA